MKRGRLYSVNAVIVGVIVLAAAHTAMGDGYRNPPASASAMGRIGGTIVQTDDASAVSVNPANIADMEKPAAIGTLTLGYASRSFKSTTGISERTEEPWAYLPSVFGVVPIEDSDLVFGIGLTVPYGRFTDWGDDVMFGAASPYYASQRVIELNPNLSTRITKNVAVALGVSVYQSDLEFKQRFPWSVLTMDASSPLGDARFCGDGFGYGANAAISWDINDNNALALTYRAPFKIEYEGDFDVTEMPAAAAALGITSSSDFETDIKYPSQVALGYGVRVSKNVHIEVDVKWIEASRNDQLSIDIENNNVLLPSTVIPQSWDDNWVYGIGADWQFHEKWTARAGFIYLETPTITATTLPVAAEDDQGVVSVGLGYDDGTHSVDLAYGMGIFDTLTVDDNVVPAVNGEYDFSSHLISMAYGYRF